MNALTYAEITCQRCQRQYWYDFQRQRLEIHSLRESGA